MDQLNKNTPKEDDVPPSTSGDESFQTTEMMEEELLKSPTSSTTTSAELESTISKLQLKDNKKKLSGAARKRFKWLVANGHDPVEAREKAMEPLQRQTKRQRSDGSTPEAETKKQKTEDARAESSSGGPPPQRKTPSSISFKQALEGKKVGILHSKYPDVNLTTDQLKAVQEAILGKILEAAEVEGTTKPKFLGTTFKAGWLNVNCADEATAQWLISTAKDLKPWDDAQLTAVEEKDLPKSSIINAFFPNSKEDKNEVILKLIKGQNSGLNTSEWRVLKRKDEGSGALLTLSIDFPSFEILKKSDFKIDFKFGQIKCWTRANKPRPTVEKQQREKGGKEAKTSASTTPATAAQAGTSTSHPKASQDKAVRKKVSTPRGKGGKPPSSR